MYLSSLEVAIILAPLLLPTSHNQWKESVLMKELNYGVWILDGTLATRAS